MREEKSLRDKIALLERELVTLTERLDETNSALKDLKDMRLELKAIKLFMGRAHPEFKSRFPEAVRKIRN